MRYYHDHELAYLRLQTESKFGWGGVASWEDFLHPPLRTSVQNFKPPCRVLELGCGTAALSIYLALRGFDVTGVDISPTAISMAHLFAERAQAELHLQVADVTALSSALGAFDLLVDSSCLHCLVFDQERAQALNKWREHMTPKGVLLLHTLIQEGPMSFGENFICDSHGVLWYRSSTPDFFDAISQEQGFLVPQRRIQSFQCLENELSEAGFRVLSHTIQSTPGKPALCRAYCVLQ